MLVDWRESDELPRREDTRYYGMRLQSVSAVIVHNTGGMESIEQDNYYHKFQAEWTPGVKGGAPHIAYHFWLPFDGTKWLEEHGLSGTGPTAVWCNHLWERSWHATNANSVAIGIALQLDGEKQEPSEDQKTAVLWLLDTLLPREFISVQRQRVFGHGECSLVYGGGPDWGNNTLCPGKYILPWIRSLRAA